MGKFKIDLLNTFAPEKVITQKYTKELGLHNSSFSDVYEDSVTIDTNTTKSLMDHKWLEATANSHIHVVTN